MEAQKAYFPIALMCQVLSVSRSGFYAWKHRQPSRRSQENHMLTTQIQQVFQQSCKTYGSPRIHAELLARGFTVGRNRVAHLMRQIGLCARAKRRFRATTDSNHDWPVAINLLKRQFHTPEPDLAWCADITYIPTTGGWLYLAVILDLFSRRVIGWSMAAHLGTQLVLEALNAALGQRVPAPAGLLFHSDRGAQYASHSYQQALSQAGITSSMSRRGNCWDNAVVESFFSTLKTELVYRAPLMAPQEAKIAIAQWIEVFYNRQRRHSVLGFLTPSQFEQQYLNTLKLISAT